jgi:hypothetical protein
MSNIESYEYKDWGITHLDQPETRIKKTIQAYYLNEWYNKVRELTYKTYFYNDLSLPEILPFSKCMVRWENKSPKDSPHWGPVSTKAEVLNMFYTSLRCKTGAGQIYCVREWDDNMSSEYRCFWNEKLVAVSSCDSSEIFDNTKINAIIEYIKSISHMIPFFRCVFDIAFTSSRPEGFVLIEFNSWETNSGAHYFDWTDDGDVMYYSEGVVFRSGASEQIVKVDQEFTTIPLCKIKTEFDTTERKIKLLHHDNNHNWLNTNNSLYVTTDAYIVRYKLCDTSDIPNKYYKLDDIQPSKWKRCKSARFYPLMECENGIIKCGDEYFYGDLTPLKTSEYSARPVPLIINCENYPTNHRYGFLCELEGCDKLVFCRILYDGKFCMTEHI